MTLKTLEKCSWEDIEVGEVFAMNGCWLVGYKMTPEMFRVIAADWDTQSVGMCFIRSVFDFFIFQPHKLPQSVQKLWKCE